jgi:hypothetical protein
MDAASTPIGIKQLTTVPDDILQTPITNLYGLCERASTGIWAEPLNALTNLGFFIGAYLIYRMYAHNPDYKGKKMWDVYFLNICMVVIGLASFGFHTVPTFYTELADVISIIIFIVVYFTAAMFRIANLSKFAVVICIMAFVFTTNSLVKYFPNALNDSIGYLSSMGALIFIALYLNIKRRAAASAFLLASILGMVSLFFRVVDREVCDQVPIGTHFIWHTCNSILLYMLMKQLLRSINRRSRMLRMAAEHGL